MYVNSQPRVFKHVNQIKLAQWTLGHFVKFLFIYLSKNVVVFQFSCPAWVSEVWGCVCFSPKVLNHIYCCMFYRVIFLKTTYSAAIMIIFNFKQSCRRLLLALYFLIHFNLALPRDTFYTSVIKSDFERSREGKRLSLFLHVALCLRRPCPGGQMPWCWQKTPLMAENQISLANWSQLFNSFYGLR